MVPFFFLITNSNYIFLNKKKIQFFTTNNCFLFFKNLLKLDADGKPIINDELLNLHLELSNSEDFTYLKNQKRFKIKKSQIKNNIYIPTYYTGVEKPLKLLEKNQKVKLTSVRELVNQKIIYVNKNGYISRGDEINSHVYGLGKIPFIRTSEITNWEVNPFFLKFPNPHLDNL